MVAFDGRRRWAGEGALPQRTADPPNAVAETKQLLRHAERVFLLVCQGDVEALLRASLLAWVDEHRESRLQMQRELQQLCNQESQKSY